jgi:hypothetical protein
MTPSPTAAGPSTCIPADGVYSSHDGCRQFHSKGTYTIPYRSLYSRSHRQPAADRAPDLRFTHVAFGSARVMCTCGLLGEVVGRAAALCHRQNRLTPANWRSHSSISPAPAASAAHAAATSPASAWPTRQTGRCRDRQSAANIAPGNAGRPAANGTPLDETNGATPAAARRRTPAGDRPAVHPARSASAPAGNG